MSGRESGADPERHPYRWVIFGAMCNVYVAFGMIVLAIPPMVTQVRTELDISRSTLGFALGAWALLYIVTAPPAGQIIDRIGLRRSLAAGSLLVATSAAVQSAARDVAMLWLAIGIIGIGGPLVSLSAPKLVAVWFTSPRERPLAVGLYTSAPALGGACALLLTNSVLLPVFGDWRSVLLFEAALNLLAALVWMLVLTERKYLNVGRFAILVSEDEPAFVELLQGRIDVVIVVGKDRSFDLLRSILKPSEPVGVAP